jgi:hypothetical protein
VTSGRKRSSAAGFSSRPDTPPGLLRAGRPDSSRGTFSPRLASPWNVDGAMRRSNFRFDRSGRLEGELLPSQAPARCAGFRAPSARLRTTTPIVLLQPKSGSDRQLEHVNSRREVRRCHQLVIVCQEVPADLFGQSHVEGVCRRHVVAIPPGNWDQRS